MDVRGQFSGIGSLLLLWVWGGGEVIPFSQPELYALNYLASP